MTDRHECEYLYHGPRGDSEECVLTGHVCLCAEDWRQCTRRAYANVQFAQHAIVPQFKGVIITDAKGNPTDVI